MATQQAIIPESTDETWKVVERVVTVGDLARLSSEERMAYYKAVCESCGLNPVTRPFEFIKLNDRLVLYATKSATDQLRRLHGVSVTITSRERVEDIYVVTARATSRDGRTDESIGAVNLGGLRGDGIANALMRAETKAKRRATLSLVGLGMLDESETDTIPGATRVRDNEPAADPGHVALSGGAGDERISSMRGRELVGLCREAGLPAGEILTIAASLGHPVERLGDLRVREADAIADELRARIAAQEAAEDALDELMPDESVVS